MQISALQTIIPVADLPPERLASSTALTEQQKIAEASRQFEALLLRQILQSAQKTTLPSEFSDNSTAAGIYQDMITNQLAEAISKSGALGLASIFERQLERQSSRKTGPGAHAGAAAYPGGASGHSSPVPVPQSTHAHERTTPNLY